MTDIKKLLHTFDEADEILNDKIERTNLSTIVASATASVENKKTVLIRGTGRNIEVLKVGGKTVQNGTPTPTNPVEVKGVGDKSVNLFDQMQNYSEAISGQSYNYKYNLKLKPNTTYTVSSNVPYSGDGKPASLYANGTASATNGVWLGNPRTITTDSNGSAYVNVRYALQDGGGYPLYDYMRNGTYYVQIQEGATATEYEPYGKYKIPILTDGKSQNIYLDAPLFDGEIADLVGGKVEKKYGILKLTGDEDWAKTGNGFFQMTLPNKNNTNVRSNAFNQVPSWSAILNSTTYTCYSDTTVIYIKITDNTATVNDFKNWLKTISAYVVYELATPSIESFDGAVIPTSVGEQELELNTEITPSSIEAETFGSYYTKSEVDKFINDLDTRLKALEPSATSLD